MGINLPDSLSLATSADEVTEKIVVGVVIVPVSGDEWQRSIVRFEWNDGSGICKTLSMLVMVLNVDCFKTNECWRLAISYVKMAATAAHLRLSDASLLPRWRRRVKGLTISADSDSDDPRPVVPFINSSVE